MKNKTKKDAEKYFMFFWGGEFSQWYPSPIEVGGIKYNCAEQYMMQQKAKMFNDKDMEILIMASKNPSEQKQYGRQVRGFDKAIWEQKAFNIVKEANIAKFSQNPKLMKVFEKSDGREIVEASPYDTIWGIGYRENDREAWNKETWRGTNLLGKVLMEVRDELYKK